MAHKLEYIFKHCTYLRLFYNICNNPKLELICQEAHKHGLSYVSAGVAGRCQGGSGSGQRRECQCSHSKATLASAGTISTYIMDRGAPALPGSRGSIDTATQSVVSSQGVNREM